jgi:restriction endonuclease Mrr
MINHKLGCFTLLLLGSGIMILMSIESGNIYFGIIISIILFWVFRKGYYTSEEDKKQNEERIKQNAEAQKNREQLIIKAAEELKKMKIDRMKAKWDEYYKRNHFSYVDKLSGIEFEKFLMKIIQEKGYSNIHLTDQTGDQGIDILFKDKDGSKVGIQAKRYIESVSNSAVQQLLGGMLFYNCQKGIIATTSKFTQSAIELASKDPRITLWDRNIIEKLYYDTMPTEIPPFSVEKAKQIGLASQIKLSSYEIDKVFKDFGLNSQYDFKQSDLEL